jgi:hypothetical protein
MKQLISNAVRLVNNGVSSNGADIEKAKVYVLLAIYDELETLNRILASKFNIEIVQEERK